MEANNLTDEITGNILLPVLDLEVGRNSTGFNYHIGRKGPCNLTDLPEFFKELAPILRDGIKLLQETVDVYPVAKGSKI